MAYGTLILQVQKYSYVVRWSERKNIDSDLDKWEIEQRDEIQQRKFKVVDL